MPLQLGYGETPLSGDELDALLPHVVNTLGMPIRKADVFDLEAAVLQDVAERLIADVFNGDLTLDELLTDQFLRDLHRQLYGDIWAWAGRWRSREVNIGVAPEQITVELRTAMDNIRYRWQNSTDWSARDLGIATHADPCAHRSIHRWQRSGDKASRRSGVHRRPAPSHAPVRLGGRQAHLHRLTSGIRSASRCHRVGDVHRNPCSRRMSFGRRTGR